MDIDNTVQPIQKKKKKRNPFLSIIKLTFAAILFGFVTGAAFQGYNYIFHRDDKVEDSSGENKITLTEVTPEEVEEEGFVPTSVSSDEMVTDVSGVVENVMPSIVAINAQINSTSYDFFGRPFQQQVPSSGSGIIIGQNDSELLIATNNHVIDNAETVEVVFSGDNKANAQIKGSDAGTDLAVLSVNIDSLSQEIIDNIKVATLGDSDTMKPGEMVIAIGNALGYGQSVTVGYISAVNREVDIDNRTMTLLQTDAAINPGNSGGALLNIEGQVIGINSVKYSSEEVEGMGYAIPITSALPMINELMNRELVEREEQGYLGINASKAQNVTKTYAERFNMPEGIYVNDIFEDSPADKAGLKQGDIIVGIDKTTVKTVDDLIDALSYKRNGQIVDLKVMVKENGIYVERILQVTLGKRPN